MHTSSLCFVFAFFAPVIKSVLGGIIILLMWLYLSVYIILIGAEVNSSIELQTSVDSTVGEDKTMGERNALLLPTIHLKICVNRKNMRTNY